MIPSLCKIILSLAIGAMISGSSQLTGAEDRIEITSVRFNNSRPPDGALNNWLELDVELDARPSSAMVGRLIEHVRIVAMLGYDLPQSDKSRRWEFFRAIAELVGMTAGRVHVRFYLPPEIVERDSLVGAPEYWLITVQGESLNQDKPLQRHSSTLSDDEVRQGFLDKTASEASKNDGVLQSQYLTPFLFAYPRSTPTYVRREAWR